MREGKERERQGERREGEIGRRRGGRAREIMTDRQTDRQRTLDSHPYNNTAYTNSQPYNNTAYTNSHPYNLHKQLTIQKHGLSHSSAPLSDEPSDALCLLALYERTHAAQAETVDGHLKEVPNRRHTSV